MTGVKPIQWQKYENGEDMLEQLRKTLQGKALVNDLINTGFRRYPDKTAIAFGDKRYTYLDLDDKTLRIANALREMGVKKGDKVALLMTNSADYLFAYFGIIRSGAVVVPVNYRLVGRELQYILGHSDSIAILMDNEYYPTISGIKADLPYLKTLIVREPPSPSDALCLSELLKNSQAKTSVLPLLEDDEVAMYYSSGTTGKPKGAILTQRNWAFTGECFCESMEFQPDDVFLIVFPMFHIAFEYVIALIHASSTMVIQKTFDVEEVVEGIERERATAFWGSPAMYILMLNSPSFQKYDVSSLRIMIYGGAIMPEDTIKRLVSAVKNVKLWNGYGITECSGHCTFLTEEFSYTKRGSVGRDNSFRGVRIRVVDDHSRPVRPNSVGEVLVRGPNIMKGYYKEPDRTREAVDSEGWFHTGDLAKIDEEGFIYIVDRQKDMIVRGGENVYPAEIENVLFEHSAILEAAVIGIPHPVLGEDQKAFVVLKHGHRLSADEIVEYCRKNLASYKVPRQIEFIDALPRNAAGKVLKDVLRVRGK